MVELHRHIEISIRLSTLLELAQARGLVPQSTSLEAFGRETVLSSPAPSLTVMLSQLSLYQAVLDRPEVFERVAFEALEDCWLEGTRQVEFRFSPAFACGASKLSWDVALDGFEAGLKRGTELRPEMRTGLICIAVRDDGMETVARAVEFFLRHRKRLLAIDLAGNEVGFPNRLYEQLFSPLKAAGEKITIHAGEAGGPEDVWEALDLLGAQRIGHGIASIRDPELVKELVKRGTCLEVCPVSNWLTTSVPSLAEHPLPQLLRAGVAVTINTDDPTVFGTSMIRELEVCRTILGLSESEIARCLQFAKLASFIPA